MRLVAWIVVALIGFITGGFAIPIGYALGLSSIEVYLSASAGAMAGLVTFMFAGDKLRTRLTRNRPPKEPDEDSRVREVANRYGEKGLGLVGPLFPGVTASVVLGLALGMDKKSLARWMTIGIAATYALYCVGLWLLVELVGVD